MKTWGELAAAYLELLKTTGRSQTTIRATERYLERFREFCVPFGALRPADVTDQHAAAFEHRLQWKTGDHGQLYSPSTVQNTLLLVRLFFRWAVKTQHLLLDPFRDIKLRRVLHFERRRILTVQEVKILLRGPELHTLAGMRDRALLEMLYGTGIRRMECAMLDVQDVDFETQTLFIKEGKGGRQRRQPMGANLQRVLRTYLDSGRPHLVRLGATNALFLRMIGGRLPAHMIGLIVRNHAQAMGLGSVTTHHLRHAFATHLLQGGAHLVEVQALLGHERLGSTAIYTGVAPLDVFADHAHTHPRAKARGPRDPKRASEGGEAPDDV